MHVEDLRWYAVRAETEHLTEAAATLGTSQPNLSRSLQRVERAFGVPLFERERRGVRLNPYGRLVLEPAHDIVQDLETGEAEIAIVAPRPDPDRFGWHVLERQRLCLHVPPGHPLASRRRVELEAARDEAFVGLQPGFGFRRVTDRLCREAGFSPQLAFEATDLATIDSLVGAGLGVAIL